VAVTTALAPFLPGPRPVRLADGRYEWAVPEQSIGRVHGWHGNALALARAWSYVLACGGDGLRRIAERAVLNATWLRHRLRGVYDIPYDRPNMHEFVASTATLKRTVGLRAADVAKRMLEEGFHAPTVYFPLTVEEALMIEPTETESPAALADAFERIAVEARQAGSADAARQAPRTTPVGRVDEARAARQLIPTFDARPPA
jgi:glycine dehydrogenase subunit 2